MMIRSAFHVMFDFSVRGLLLLHPTVTEKDFLNDQKFWSIVGKSQNSLDVSGKKKIHTNFVAYCNCFEWEIDSWISSCLKKLIHYERLWPIKFRPDQVRKSRAWIPHEAKSLSFIRLDILLLGGVLRKRVESCRRRAVYFQILLGLFSFCIILPTWAWRLN